MPTLRRFGLGLVALMGASLGVGSSANAQFSPFQQADPFSLYYGFYLPRQAALAAQPSATDTLNYISAERQRSAIAARNRAAYSDPISSFGLDELDEYADPSQPINQNRRGTSAPRRLIPFNGVTSTNVRGQGVPGRFSNTLALYPTPRPNQYKNSNVAVTRSRPAGGGGGFGGGGFGGGGFGGGGFGS